MINILVADDHQIIRDGIRSLLKDVKEIRILAEAENGEDVMQQMAEHPSVNLVLMDINMPVMNGLETTRVLKKQYPLVNILALSMHDEEKYVSEMLQAGALGYVLKKTGKQELVNAIKTAAMGSAYFSNEVSAMLFERLTTKTRPATSSQAGDSIPLTKREIEILTLIAGEYTNPQIAEKLNISARTVDTHRRNLLQKLDVKNTAGLVKYAVQKGLL